MAAVKLPIPSVNDDEGAGSMVVTICQMKSFPLPPTISNGSQSDDSHSDGEILIKYKQSRQVIFNQPWIELLEI